MIDMLRWRSLKLISSSYMSHFPLHLKNCNRQTKESTVLHDFWCLVKIKCKTTRERNITYKKKKILISSDTQKGVKLKLKIFNGITK